MPNELTVIHPITGELIDTSSVDRMAEAWESIQKVMADLSAVAAQIRYRLGQMSTGETKTRRVRGDRCRMRIEMPSDKWDSAALRELWITCPYYAIRYLRIGEIVPIMAEIQKLKNETGDAMFMKFREAVLNANRGPHGLPRITIEEVDSVQPSEPKMLEDNSDTDSLF